MLAQVVLKDWVRVIVFSLIGWILFTAVANGDDYITLPVDGLACEKFVSSTDLFKSVTWCASSVLTSQEGNTYRPRNLASDGAWCEGVDGYGIGETIEIHYEPHDQADGPPAFDRLIIANGYNKSARVFRENSRIKRIEIKTDEGDVWTRTLSDEIDPQVVQLGKEVRSVAFLLTILEVYPGDKYTDTCLSTLIADFGQ